MRGRCRHCRLRRSHSRCARAFRSATRGSTRGRRSTSMRDLRIGVERLRSCVAERQRGRPARPAGSRGTPCPGRPCSPPRRCRRAVPPARARPRGPCPRLRSAAWCEESSWVNSLKISGSCSRGMPGPVSLTAISRRSAAALEAHPHRAGIRVLDRVGDQVVDDLAHAVRIRVERAASRRANFAVAGRAPAHSRRACSHRRSNRAVRAARTCSCAIRACLRRDARNR